MRARRGSKSGGLNKMRVASLPWPAAYHRTPERDIHIKAVKE